ncbi:MAG: alpha-amylase family glycosyl hydrolase [Bacteroidales bacterium]|nr:alpha-amylase family glycosyl hydrolase [Bacteroidales bacterium]
MKKEIYYHIFIDRFAGYKKASKGIYPKFLGGSLGGIIDKLDYLVDLGVDVIWLSPFYSTTAYHGYHIIDFENVDPHFGTLNDLVSLIKLAHAKNLKVICDFVPNHCSLEHPFFIHAQNHHDSVYRDWFYFKKWPHDYLCFLHFDDLPKLNLENSETTSYFLDLAKYWCSFGFDGFRIDHVIGIPNSFLHLLNDTVKGINPDFLLLGEAWGGGLKYRDLPTLRMEDKHAIYKRGLHQNDIQMKYIDVLDGVLDFEGQSIISRVTHKDMSNDVIQKALLYHYSRYPETFLLPSFLDNHDINRFFFTCNQNMDQYKQAFEISLKSPHPTIIYYGDEIPKGQTKDIFNNDPFADIHVRQPMNWNKAYSPFRQWLKEEIQKRKAGS